MTRDAFTAAMILLDNLWGGVDEGREAGYWIALSDYDDDLVGRVIDGMRGEDRTWLPKPAEIAFRARRLQGERRTVQRAQRRLEASNRAALESEF